MKDFNFGYLGTTEGILKLIQLILGTLASTFVLYYEYCGSFIYLQLAFLIGTFILVFAIVFGSGMDVLYEGIYHLFGFLALLGGSIDILILSADKRGFKVHDFNITGGALGLLNCVFYLISCIIAFRANS